MKTAKLMICTLCTAVLAALVFVGCEKLDPYSIDAPSDLQNRIDSIEAAKAGAATGDTTYLSIATAIVGPEDNSAGWWAYFSDYFTIPANKLLVLEYVNHGTGVNNWNNWNLAIVNVADRDADNYSEYFVLRSDAYGWGNDDFDLAMISQNYPDIDGDEDIWNDFRSIIQGAYVTLKIDHSVTGNVFVTATAVGTDGTKIEMTYQQPVSATEDIVAFLICDGSYFEMKNAYLIPSIMTAVDDVNPVSITVEGIPPFVEIGDTNFWGDAVATVTFADGSSSEVDSADLSFLVVPDMTTLGEKIVSVAYSKSKQGEYTQAVSTFYMLEVVNSVSSIEITTLPDITEYYFYNDTSGVILDITGLVVTATYSDGTTGVIANNALEFGEIPAVEGAQAAVISYDGATSTVTANCPVTLVRGISQVGASDFTTGWWSEFSSNYAVASGSSTTLTMYCYSNEVNNWNSPCVILRKADATENAVVRMDNFGWGDGYVTAALSNDWNWDTFTPNINGSKVVVTVTNNGDNSADIHYDVTYNNGEAHFQLYEGITVESADLNYALVCEGSYLVIVNNE
ncbi:MAG: hypothetical protein JXA77_19305 [Bacteroidales bacterium]|nr:hypothetical protein [Bacteroidales bacterium]